MANFSSILGAVGAAAGGPVGAIGAGLISGIPSLLAAGKQKRAYKNLKLQDTTPEPFKEALALSRQNATSQLPGLGAGQNRLAATQAGATSGLLRGSGSTAALLGGLTAGVAQRQAGEQQLGIQGEQFRQRGQDQLRRDLATQADYNTNDLNNYNKERAALKQSSNENLSRGIGAITGGLASGINIGQQNKYTDAINKTSQLGGGGVGGGLMSFPPLPGKRRSPYSGLGVQYPSY
ncbi:hypothetical protein [Hymenobacter glacieicola]|uniref:Glycine zipper domain-containing protein n=1 Tax=Hymenobacter glacieicola TaxID=1562124 RepID=A0ABQ1X5V5_9BACT|nr:hypothetical protein [Hymenobacter glacieicola]GGG61365.1 hypothetical protein GCM10011378_41750 [Hymenobacter glacieicola]